MATDVVRVCLIGTGWFGGIHARLLAEEPGVELAAVCDVVEKRARQVADELGASGAYTDYRQMLDEVRPDAAWVVTTHDRHEEPTLAALEAGCHVFVEKPIAGETAAGRRMAAAAEKAGKVMAVGHVARFSPSAIALHQKINDGEMGEILGASFRRRRPLSALFDGSECHPVVRMGIHDLDLMLWLLGHDIEWVQAAEARQVRGLVPHYMAMFGYANGALATVETSFIQPDSYPAWVESETYVFGEGTVAHLRSPAGAFHYYGEEGLQYPETASWARTFGLPTGTLGAEMQRFLQCVRENRLGEPFDTEDAVRAVRLTELVRESAARGERIPVTWGT